MFCFADSGNPKCVCGGVRGGGSCYCDSFKLGLCSSDLVQQLPLDGVRSYAYFWQM